MRGIRIFDISDIANPRLITNVPTCRGSHTHTLVTDANDPDVYIHVSPMGPSPDQCHDITVYPELGLAGGACEGHGFLLDISDPANPSRRANVTDPNFAYGHSATFNNDGIEDPVHGRVGWRHVPQVPRNRPPGGGRERDLHARRERADVP